MMERKWTNESGKGDWAGELIFKGGYESKSEIGQERDLIPHF